MSGKPDILYYDGGCALCRRCAAILRAIDWGHRIELVDLTAVTDEELPVDRQTALDAIPMRTADGRTLLGFSAARRSLLRTPLGFIPALPLYLPGAKAAGDRIYHYISSRRVRDGCGAGESGDACRSRGRGD